MGRITARRLLAKGTAVRLMTRAQKNATDLQKLGAVLASAFWFFALSYGASKLSALFRHPAAWRTLDVVSGSIMVGIAEVMGASLYHSF